MKPTEAKPAATTRIRSAATSAQYADIRQLRDTLPAKLAGRERSLLTNSSINRTIDLARRQPRPDEAGPALLMLRRVFSRAVRWDVIEGGTAGWGIASISLE
jgi:hypothetical protein